MAVVVKAFRLLGGDHWTPQAIQFAHEEPADTSEHLRVFGCRPSFDRDANAVVVERNFVERLVPAADLKLYRVLKQHAEHILNDVPRETDFRADVRRAIAEAMRDGDPRLARVAAKLAMSPRTLQRRLDEEGVIFKALVDDTRLRFALGYLRHGGHTLTEIAFLLGYSEVSALNRAFKRWTGVTPSGYREVGELSGTRPHDGDDGEGRQLMHPRSVIASRQAWRSRDARTLHARRERPAPRAREDPYAMMFTPPSTYSVSPVIRRP